MLAAVTGKLLAFSAFSLLLAITPGPDFALVTRNALAFGRRGALFTCAGLTAGVAMWVVASAVGLAVVLERSTLIYTIVRVAGAAYLAYLGVTTLLASRRRPAPLDVAAVRPASRSRIWSQGMLSSSLNPKLGVFFVSVLPQFIDPHAALAESLLFGGIFLVIGIAWMTLYGLSVSRLREKLLSPRVRQWLARATGVALLGFGAKLLADAG
jgi:threonine/homoserine/homoserine lactone efflux protein